MVIFRFCGVVGEPRHGWDGQPNPPTNGQKTEPVTEPAVWVSSPVFDGAHWDETEESRAEGTIENLFAKMHVDGAGGADGGRDVEVDHDGG